MNPATTGLILSGLLFVFLLSGGTFALVQAVDIVGDVANLHRHGHGFSLIHVCGAWRMSTLAISSKCDKLPAPASSPGG